MALIPDTPHTSTPLQRLRHYFLAGIAVSAPITITIYVTLLFLDFIDDHVRQLLPGILPDTGIPGLGLVVAGLGFVILGWLATNFLGELLINIAEGIVARTPVVRSIYGGLKQVFETVMGSQAKAFREAVLVRFPHPDSWAIGFVTGHTDGEVAHHAGDVAMLNVFVPTTPVPTGGFLMFVREDHVIRLQMHVDDALKMVISGAMVTPPDRSLPVSNPNTTT